MRQSIAAVALIRREREGQTQWLAQWNRNWQRYSFVGGHRHSGETFRDCAIREVAEELGLVADAEFRVFPEPCVRLEVAGWSVSAQQDTHYTFEVFHVELTTEAALEKVSADSRNRWLSESEIARGHTDDGSLVSELMSLVLAERKAATEPG